MHIKFGAYLILQLKYDDKKVCYEALNSSFKPFCVQTMDINENVKNMFDGKGEHSIGNAYCVPKEYLASDLQSDSTYSHCRVTDSEGAYQFEFLDSYIYIFNTRIAFLCLGLSFDDMKALSTICNPGFAENDAKFEWIDTSDTAHGFSINCWLEDICRGWELKKFYTTSSSMLLESYAYILAQTDTAFADLEQLRHTTYNLHRMQSPEIPIEDDSEADIRYVYAVKNSSLNGYRWGCCVTSQTIAYAVADVRGEFDIKQEMLTQAEDGLPLVMLALYEKYTCLRFTELIAASKGRNLKYVLELKKLMLKFQAFGTVTPANLSRWNNVKQIYAYLLEVSETYSAVQDISHKINILVEQQQEIENQRNSRVVNLVTVFGVVGIMSSVQSIVQILSDGNNLMWSVTFLTMALMALCFGLAMRK